MTQKSWGGRLMKSTALCWMPYFTWWSFPWVLSCLGLWTLTMPSQPWDTIASCSFIPALCSGAVVQHLKPVVIYIFLIPKCWSRKGNQPFITRRERLDILSILDSDNWETQIQRLSNGSLGKRACHYAWQLRQDPHDGTYPHKLSLDLYICICPFHQ